MCVLNKAIISCTTRAQVWKHDINEKKEDATATTIDASGENVVNHLHSNEVNNNSTSYSRIPFKGVNIQCMEISKNSTIAGLGFSNGSIGLIYTKCLTAIGILRDSINSSSEIVQNLVFLKNNQLISTHADSRISLWDVESKNLVKSEKIKVSNQKHLKSSSQEGKNNNKGFIAACIERSFQEDDGNSSVNEGVIVSNALGKLSRFANGEITQISDTRQENQSINHFKIVFGIVNLGNGL